MAHAVVSNDGRRLHENELRILEDLQPDLFGWLPEAEPGAAARSTSRAKARRDHRAAIREKLAAPWGTWSETGRMAHVAMRYLSRYPHLDRPDPAYDLLTERQAAAEYHLEEEALEVERAQR